MNSYRTHTCDELRPAHVDQVVTLVGWVDTVRDHGGVIFIDLRDRAGKTQVVFHPEIDANLANQAEALRVETVIQVTGKVVRRLKTDEIDATNPDLATGEIEVEATSLTVLNPAAVLPFQLSREKAVEAFRNFCKKRWFLPSDFTSSAQEEKIVGLYVPFWVTDCDVAAEMDAIGRKERSWVSGDTRYTEHYEYALVRKADVVLEGLPADGASHVDDTLMEALEPFDYSQTKPFAMQYLSGFIAEKYDVDTAGVFPRIQKRAVQASDQLLRSSMSGYNSVSVTRADIKVQKTDWKYMLLPVWFMTYKYQDKMYEFAVNGQSGKFVGTPPLSRTKHLLATAGIGLAAAILTGLVVMLL